MENESGMREIVSVLVVASMAPTIQVVECPPPEPTFVVVACPPQHRHHPHDPHTHEECGPHFEGPQPEPPLPLPNWIRNFPDTAMYGAHGNSSVHRQNVAAILASEEQGIPQVLQG